MFPFPQQMPGAAGGQIETQLAMQQALIQALLESAEKVARLNLAAARASFEESTSMARQALSVRDPQELMGLMRAQSGPTLGKAIAYGNHLIRIVSEMQSDMLRTTESGVADAARKSQSLFEETAKSGASGLDKALSPMKAMFANTGNGAKQPGKPVSAPQRGS